MHDGLSFDIFLPYRENGVFFFFSRNNYYSEISSKHGFFGHTDVQSSNTHLNIDIPKRIMNQQRVLRRKPDNARNVTRGRSNGERGNVHCENFTRLYIEKFVSITPCFRNEIEIEIFIIRLPQHCVWILQTIARPLE